MASPSIEWVDGNLVRARQFTFIDGASIVIALLILTIVLLATFTALLGGTLSAAELGGIAFTASALSGAVSIFAFSRLPRRWPVVKRLGISPMELRLDYSFRKLKTPWNLVRWRDRDHIEVLRGGRSTEFLLTEPQAERVRRFLPPAPPLPSSSATVERGLVQPQ
jgi:hypothetical protein